MEGFPMTGTQPFQSTNRRNSADRRQREDRRAHAIPTQPTADENEILRELLHEAHGRIRELEQAISRLTASI
jgi:hypothetical protein